ncbi:hypothetical protein TrVE_jg6939 [Triparma verrucosa]|uniref:Uncharacterized protein n=1 Tax=Triparma verrucosa TaxID=1606542 RepID=A0A9W7F3Z6_9STRA|nr:hypothetical protein TrVE_jg6939 [Triparma verrucosa]
MSKRTSEQLPNVLEIANPNHLEGGDEEEDVFEGSEVDSAAVDTPATGVPSDINLNDNAAVVAYLRSIQ